MNNTAQPGVGNGKFTPDAILAVDCRVKSEPVKEVDPLYNVFLGDRIISEAGTEGKVANPNLPYIQVVKPSKRNFDGLLNDITYIYKNGRIDWEAMFNPEYLVYPNNDPTKTPLLKTDGLLDLADIRGVESKKVEIKPISDTMIAVSVEMRFIPNIDNPSGLVWSGAADATPINIGGKQFSKYLTTIAETRAVGRCIRGALNIRLCTFEEVSKDDLGTDESDAKPISDEAIVAIERQMKLKAINYDSLMKKIQEKHPKISSLNQLSISQGRAMLSWLNDMKNAQTTIKE